MSLAKTSTPHLSLEPERPVVNRRHRRTYSHTNGDIFSFWSPISILPDLPPGVGISYTLYAITPHLDVSYQPAGRRCLRVGVGIAVPGGPYVFWAAVGTSPLPPAQLTQSVDRSRPGACHLRHVDLTVRACPVSWREAQRGALNSRSEAAR